jgi:hypothetical protein
MNNKKEQAEPKKPGSRIPTIAGVLVLVIGLAAGVYLVQSRQVFKLGASPEFNPKNVRVTNITDSSFNVSWTTNKATEGFIKWGGSEKSLSGVETDEIKGDSFTHYVTVQDLSVSTEYFFIINSGGTEFNNNGIAWSTKTGPSIPAGSLRSLSPISGRVLDTQGKAVRDALVYVNIAGGAPLSTTTSGNGRWVLPISVARTQDLSSFLEIDESSTLVEVSVQAGSLGIANAQVYPTSARPVPEISLGQVHDFRNLPPSEPGEIPESSIGLPDTEDIATPVEDVSLDSVEEGEVVTTDKPEFFGEGPPGTTIKITIESEVVKDEIKVNVLGNWKWSPPENLEEGVHKITISWNDANGILRTISRTFIVSAQEGPAFESTPSGTTPTPTPTSTPTPSPTPSASPTSTPTLTPSPTPISTSTPSPTRTPTATPLPDAGSLTPTVILLTIGIVMLVVSSTLFLSRSETFKF